MLWIEGNNDRSPGYEAGAGLCMTASEQMYFLGAPLAHVLHYEDELRDDRLRRATSRPHARRTLA